MPGHIWIFADNCLVQEKDEPLRVKLLENNLIKMMDSEAFTPEPLISKQPTGPFHCCLLQFIKFKNMKTFFQKQQKQIYTKKSPEYSFDLYKWKQITPKTNTAF